MAENVIIGFPDWTELASWSGGSWQVAFPVSNAGSDEMAAVARSTDATEASTQLSADLGVEELVDLVAVVLPNASIDARMRLTLKDGGGSQIAQTDWFDVFPPAIPTDELLWEDDRFWLGKFSDSELDGALWTRPFRFDQAYLAQTIGIEISDTANADGFVDVAYAAIAQAWQLGLNPSPGAQFGFLQGARTQAVQARGGAKAFDRLSKPNGWRGTVDLMDRDEALARGFEHQRQMDIDRPFIWWPYPDEPRHWLRTVFVARTRRIRSLRHAAQVLALTEFPINVEQVL